MALAATLGVSPTTSSEKRVTLAAAPATPPSTATPRAFGADGLSLSAAAKAPDGTAPALALAQGLIDALGKADVPPGGKLDPQTFRTMHVAYLDSVNVLPLDMQPIQSWFYQAARKTPAGTLDAGQVAAALTPMLPFEQGALGVMIDNVAADRRALAASGFVGDDPSALIREISDLTSGKTAPNDARKAVLQTRMDAYNAVVDDHNTLIFALSLVGDLVGGRNGRALPDAARLQRKFAQCNTYALAHQKERQTP